MPVRGEESWDWKPVPIIHIEWTDLMISSDAFEKFLFFNGPLTVSIWGLEKNSRKTGLEF